MSNAPTSNVPIVPLNPSFKYENGRCYYTFSGYPVPNDSIEQGREDRQGDIFEFLKGSRLYTPPIDALYERKRSSLKILDLGTGTGTWLIKMANEFPFATKCGSDIAPVWTEDPRCNFRGFDHNSDDFQDWPFPEDYRFDYIHGRALAGTVKNWDKFYQNVFNKLEPGGWIEMQEFDMCFFEEGTHTEAVKTKEWKKRLVKASEKNGGRRLIITGKEHEDWIKRAGFENVVVTPIDVPIGPWKRYETRIGEMEYDQMKDLIEAYCLRLFTRGTGVSADDVRKNDIEPVLEELKNLKYELKTRYYFITAMKPI